MTHYGQIANGPTPQNEQARADQKQNHAGGFVFAIDKWKQLDRFLILGQCGPTYYATERAVVKENVDVLKACLAENGVRAVARIVEISDAGRAPKNDPAIFALAMAVGDPSRETRFFALKALPAVCRIGTHLFKFASDVERGWGRGLRTAVAHWYLEKKDRELAMQAIKYQQREGWSHRDLLRLAHPEAARPEQEAAFRWMTGGADALSVERKRGKAIAPETLPALIVAFEAAKQATNVADVVSLITTHGLPREVIPTQWLNEAKVWDALLPHMGATAMLRNLGKMTAVGLLGPMGEASRYVARTISDHDTIAKARVHPLAMLVAAGVYGQGHGDKGKLSWAPVREIGEGLEAGFYEAFKAVEPNGKRHLLGIDISGSMDSGMIAGCPGITPRIGSALMAMVTARAEENWHMVGFTSGGFAGTSGNGLTPIDVRKNDRLDAVKDKFQRLPMGGTDCALPMLYAAAQKIPVDVFHVYTDSETWHGAIHPFQALQAYRQRMGIDAKLVVVGMTATEFSIAPQDSAECLDVVGFDTHAPSLISSFSKGEL